MADASLNPRAVYYIAKKEFADNIRNKWVIALTIIFVIMTLVSSYLAAGKGGGSKALGGMEETVLTLISISSILIPIIAIMLGYATISGEAESGSLNVLLAYPVRRTEILLGKFLGLGSVLVFSILMGFGMGGIIIIASAGTGSVLPYLGFMGFSIITGLIYLSLAMCFSSVMKKRATSLGAAIFIFFWSMIAGMVAMGIFLAQGGDLVGLVLGTEVIPNWFWAYIFISPMDMCQTSVMLAFGVKQLMGYSVEPPSFMNLWTLLFAQLVWIFVPLVLSIYSFNRRDF